MAIESEIQALSDLAESVLMDWLNKETPSDRRRQKALESLADAGCCLHVACINLGLLKSED
jgi:hypothetical protein